MMIGTNTSTAKKMRFRFVSLIFFIFLLNYLAMTFHWYSSIWYLDMPMHFLGGVWIAMAIIWVIKLKKITLYSILEIFFIVLLIGIFWEIFEIIVNKTITGNSFNLLDTLSDVCFDLSGSLFAIFYFLKYVMVEEENKI